MKLSKLKRLMDDLSYICGLVFIDNHRYKEFGVVDSRTIKKVIKKLKHKLWLDSHEEISKAITEKRLTTKPKDI